MSLDSIKTPSIVFTHKYFNCFPIGIPVGTRLTTDWVKKVFVSKKSFELYYVKHLSFNLKYLAHFCIISTQSLFNLKIKYLLYFKVMKIT